MRTAVRLQFVFVLAMLAAQCYRAAPAFALSSASDERWSKRFFPNGQFETVHAVAYDGQTVYAEGSGVGLDYKNEVASWQGRAWVSHGRLENRRVTDFAVVGSDVFACGTFARFDGPHSPFIARWDGAKWNALGAGLDGPALKIYAWKGDLYAAGEFGVAGGIAARHVAKWDGNAWSALGDGLAEDVVDLASDDNKLYALSAGRIAAWNGASWKWLLPPEEYPSDIEVFGSELYAAGNVNADGSFLEHWDGFFWEDVSNGLITKIGSSLSGIAVAGDRLYLAESQTNPSYTSAARVSSFDGHTWNLVSDDFTGKIVTVASSGDALIVAGEFDAIGNVAAPRIAKWDGTRWTGLGYSGGLAPTGSVEALNVHDGKLYAGGAFRAIANTAAHGIASWDGRLWSSIGDGTDGVAMAMLWCGDDLYAGGTFSRAGDVPASAIAKWDGTSWSALGSGIRTSSGRNGLVLTLTEWKGDVYAGGSFSFAGGNDAEGIAKWDGTMWSAVGDGVSGYVSALVPIGEYLYAGGDFDGAASSRKGLKRWDGSSWSDINDFEGVVATMAAVEQGLLISGLFYKTGDVQSPSLVLFDGERFVAWPDPLPQGIWIRAIATSGPDVFVAGGGFLARWDGMQWSSLGSGVYGNPFAVAATDRDVFVGGELWTAGGNTVEDLAKFCFAESCELCGDANGDEILTATDALGVLRAAVGAAECALLVCDFNGDSTVTASDALGVLKASVGLPVPGLCAQQVL